MGIVLSLVLLALGVFVLSPRGERLLTRDATPSDPGRREVAPATLPTRVFIGALLVVAGLVTLLTALG
ncbi:hypothetical protein [Patulibacter minatonensis]|uniref:hypothetical protein n=1 Tax=Patulibacter minatonensis TaxID=298163 RepID=UPI0004792CDE|nr:hypothetical protein [Patulibacter minatonensis]